MDKCVYCGRPVFIDMEGDLIHNHLDGKGIDPRLCEPSNPDSKIAKTKKPFLTEEEGK